MFDLVASLINGQLGPLIEQITALHTELDDVHRRLENLNRIGTCSQVDPDKNRCKVKHGDLETPWIKWFNPSAGEQRETRIPSVGEQCVLINYGAGDGGAQSVAMFGLDSDAFPPVSSNQNITRRTHKDGTEASYDHGAHVFNWKNGPTSVMANQDGIELMVGGAGIKISAGGVSLLGKVDNDSVDIGKDHVHTEVQVGPDDSGAPKK